MSLDNSHGHRHEIKHRKHKRSHIVTNELNMATTWEQPYNANTITCRMHNTSGSKRPHTINWIKTFRTRS